MLLAGAGPSLADHMAAASVAHSQTLPTHQPLLVHMASPSRTADLAHAAPGAYGAPPPYQQRAVAVDGAGAGAAPAGHMLSDEVQRSGGPALTPEELMLASGAFNPDKYREYSRQVCVGGGGGSVGQGGVVGWKCGAPALVQPTAGTPAVVPKQHGRSAV